MGPIRGTSSTACSIGGAGCTLSVGAGPGGGEDAPSNNRCWDPLVHTSDWRTARTGSVQVTAPFPLLLAMTGDGEGPGPVPLPLPLVVAAGVVFAVFAPVSVSVGAVTVADTVADFLVSFNATELPVSFLVVSLD